MVDKEHFEICKKLSKEAYKDRLQDNIDGWQGIDEREYKKVICLDKTIEAYQKFNFACVAYKKDDSKEIILAFRGTDDFVDLFIIDPFFVKKEIPIKASGEARVAYNNLKKRYPDFKFYLTGHSLGGAYAQLLCYQLKQEKQECSAITFNPPGTAYALVRQEENKEMEELIDNYVVMNDFVGTYRLHMGKTHYIQPYPFDKPDPENHTKKQTPHGAILYYNEAEFGPIIDKIDGFRKENAWALWFYDVKNTDISNQIFKPIIDIAIEQHNLIDAMAIIKNENIKLLNTFEYNVEGISYHMPEL